MDILSAVQTAIIQTVGGESVEFPRITMRELAELTAEIKNELRTRTKQNADDAKFSPVQKFRAMQETDYGEITTARIMDRVDTPAGSEWVVRRSLTKGGLDDKAESILANLDPVEIASLALRIVGVRPMSIPATNGPAPVVVKSQDTAGFGDPSGGDRPLSVEGFAPPDIDWLSQIIFLRRHGIPDPAGLTFDVFLASVKAVREQLENERPKSIEEAWKLKAKHDIENELRKIVATVSDSIDQSLPEYSGLIPHE